MSLRKEFKDHLGQLFFFLYYVFICVHWIKIMDPSLIGTLNLTLITNKKKNELCLYVENFVHNLFLIHIWAAHDLREGGRNLTTNWLDVDQLITCKSIKIKASGL